MDIFNLIPPEVFSYVGMGVLFFLLFHKKIPFFSKIRIKVELPEEFMRQFRWITPLLLFISLYALKKTHDEMVEIKKQIGEIKQIVTPIP